MKKGSVLLCVIVLLWFVNIASATSPMPEEVKPGQTASVCTVHFTGVADREKGIPDQQTATFAFDASEAKQDVLEWITRYISSKFSERNVSEFRIECRFPK